MTKQKAWDFVDEILVPLAEAFEKFNGDAYPPVFYSHLKLDDALRRHNFETARRIFEYFKSPAFAHAFERAVEAPVVRLRKFETKTRRMHPDNWPDGIAHEYAEILYGIEQAADYMRQLAWMIKSNRGEMARSKGSRSNLYGKGLDGLGNKKTELSGWYADNIFTPRQRDCFSLRYEYGLPLDEIAARLKIRGQTVEEHIEAANRKIRNAQSKGKLPKMGADEIP
jgi:DNA-binding CsgD family transcriptional regulator